MTKQHTDLLCVVLCVFSAFTTAWIFSNSAQSAQQSLEASDKLSELVLPMIDSGTEHEDRITATYLVRKTAHVLEYALLSLFCVGAALCRAVGRVRGWSIAACFLYMFCVAASDEYIQSFFDRTSSVKDVFIDLFGCVLGACCVLLIRALLKKSKKFRSVENSTENSLS